MVVEGGPYDLDTTSAGGRLLAARLPRVGSGRRRIVLRFTTSPVELLGAGGVTGLRVVANRLVTGADGVVRAEPTDRFETIEAGLVVRSVGFRGEPVADLPFDSATGTVPNDGGRVEPGVYVAGWIKRGPTGFIGTNKTCAQETVAKLLDDLDSGLAARAGTAVLVGTG